MSMLTKRIDRLELTGTEVPPHVRRWLGDTLTEEQNAAADIEMARDRHGAPATRLSASDRAWLHERDAE